MGRMERKGKTSPTQPETPVARLSAPPGPPSSVPVDVKSLLPDDAGRYSKNSKRSSSQAGVLSPREGAVLDKLRERAPYLARLIAGSMDAGQARDGLRELEGLLTAKRT